MRMPGITTRLLALFLLSALPFLASANSDSLLPLEYESDSGRLILEIEALDEPMIYTNTLAGGVGLTGPLLDRGQLGVNAIVRFQRHGDRVLLIQDDSQHHSLGDNEHDRRAVRESFPDSVLASLPIEEETDNGLRVDATDFVLKDIFGVRETLENADQGRLSLDRDRSHVMGEQTGAHPDNSEIRVRLTFDVENAGSELRSHTPDARSLSIEQQHSFIRIPDSTYRPRAFHPQAGIFPHILFDFAQGHDSDYRRRWIWRWHLEPEDPEAYLDGELVEPKEPIVYYLDPAIPEPYRSAFREGGLWWNEAFEAAGFKNAFQIRDLPEDADPMDSRYNMIHWVHRRERGPSVGPHYRDPNTGEIIRSIVRMDSFRSLVNHDIWMGFLPAAGPEGLAIDSEEMAMQRRKQHSAHEIGHTLGLAHNFIAATHDRASVMDYPVALARLDEDGELDISEAYADGLGEHDKLAIRYAYTWFPDEESEREGLAEIMEEFRDQGMRFITGGDAAVSGSIPDATTWVEGNDMVSAVERTMAVRNHLIEHFDERALSEGEPMFYLNKRFAHVYFHHRTALQGLGKAIGGMEYRYAMAGEEEPPTRIVPAEEQREALDKLLSALHPSELMVPERISELMAPEPFGWDSGWGWQVDEQFIDSPGGAAFDPLYLAHSLARELVDHLLHPERMARSASFHERDSEQPAPGEIMDRLIEISWEATAEADEDAYLRRVQRAVLDGILDLAGDERATSSVKAAAESRLKELREKLETRWSPWRAREESGARGEHRALARRDIDRYLEGRDDPERRHRPAPIELPWP